MDERNIKEATEKYVSAYLAEKVTSGIATTQIYAALSARFNTIENKSWSFKGLNKNSNFKNPHHAWTFNEMQSFFKLIKCKRIDMIVAVHVLWDMAGRP